MPPSRPRWAPWSTESAESEVGAWEGSERRPKHLCFSLIETTLAAHNRNLSETFGLLLASRCCHRKVAARVVAREENWRKSPFEHWESQEARVLSKRSCRHCSAMTMSGPNWLATDRRANDVDRCRLVSAQCFRIKHRTTDFTRSERPLDVSRLYAFHAMATSNRVSRHTGHVFKAKKANCEGKHGHLDRRRASVCVVSTRCQGLARSGRCCTPRRRRHLSCLWKRAASVDPTSRKVQSGH